MSRMIAPRILVMVMALGLGCGAASAQKADPFAALLTDPVVKSLRQQAVENIHRGQCEGGVPCQPANDAEKRNPPLSMPDSRKILRNSYVTGMAQWCGLDWQRRGALPFLRKQTAGGAYSDRQVALIAMLHGLGQKTMMARLGKYGSCPAATRQSLEQNLPRG